MHLREAKLTDSKIIFEWANDPQMRINSFKSEEIDWNSHIIWFNSKLKNNESKIFLLIENDKQIGQIRFDKEFDRVYIDFYISSDFRGRGFGSKILILGVKEIINIWSDITEIIGEVKSENIPSRKAFIKAGFNESKENDYFQYKRHIK